MHYYLFGCNNSLSARAARRLLPRAPGARSSRLNVTKKRTTAAPSAPELTYVPWKPPDPPGIAGGRRVLSFVLTCPPLAKPRPIRSQQTNPSLAQSGNSRFCLFHRRKKNKKIALTREKQTNKQKSAKHPLQSTKTPKKTGKYPKELFALTREIKPPASKKNAHFPIPFQVE